MPNQEIELKFEIDAAAAERLERILIVRPGAKGAPPQPKSLVSAYYDTPDCAVMRAGLGVRVREVGDKHIQTVKAECGGLSARGEWECEVRGLGLDLAALKDTPAGEVIKAIKGELLPLFATRVERTAYAV